MVASKERKSTVKGLKYPSGRDGGLRTLQQWLDGKRQDDGAEGLWRIGDKLYDLESWIKNHPGGAEWIDITRGTDITEAFEVHHVMPTAERLLPKFYVREAATPRACPFTFAPDGFYRRFKARAREALKNVDIHKSATFTNLAVDGFCATALFLGLIAAASQSWLFVIASGVVWTWTTNLAHNYVHQRNNFRMLYLDLAAHSSKDWRVSHALSHHIYTNTVLDLEISVYEPLLQWLPSRDKPIVPRFFYWIYMPIVYGTIIFLGFVKRYYSVIYQRNRLDSRDLIPFVVPALMCLVAPPFEAFWTWAKIIAVNSTCFAALALNGAHHHPDIYHDGDARREDPDWGLAQLDAVRDRVVVEESTFCTLVNFGHHTLHHLLPTIDVMYLNLCEPAFQKTCKEFQVDSSLWPQWRLIVGQFAQLSNATPKQKPNGR